MAGILSRIVAAVGGHYRLQAALAGTVVCIGVAVLYALEWPGTAPPHAGGVRAFILRWAHPAVWLLLGAACVLVSGRRAGSSTH